MLKINALEQEALKKSEMEIITGGEHSSYGTCDICHFTKSEKANKELADNTPTDPTTPVKENINLA